MSGLKALQLSLEPAISSGYFRECELSVYDGENHLDLEHINRPSGSYDVILCNHVLEHIPNDNKAFSELLRVTSPGGLIEMSVPIRENTKTNDWNYADQRQDGHHRVYGFDIWQRFQGDYYVLQVLTHDPVTGTRDYMFFITTQKSRCQELFKSLVDKFPVQWKHINNIKREMRPEIDALLANLSSLAGKDVAAIGADILTRRPDVASYCVSSPYGAEKLLFWLWLHGRKEDKRVKAGEAALLTALRWLNAGSQDSECPGYTGLVHALALSRDGLSKLAEDTAKGHEMLLDWFQNTGRVEMEIGQITAEPSYDFIWEKSQSM